MQAPSLFSENPVNKRLCGAVVMVYAITLFTGILRHELWLDEAHHFLLALYSNSLPEMMFNGRYDGHPFAWNILLFVITRFSADPFYMQVLNVLISSVGVWIFTRYAPFSWPFKLLAVFGYFSMYEYGIISRNYALSSTLFFAVLAVYRYRANHRMLFALIVVLFANTHLFAAWVSIVLLFQMLLEYFLYGKKEEEQSQIWPAAIFMICGIALALYQCIPPAGSFQAIHADTILTSYERDNIISMPFRALFMLPDIASYYNWNTNYFTIHYWSYCKWLFPLPFVLTFILLYRKPLSLILFLFGSIGVMALAYFSLSTASRHCGFIYLYFIGALWMSRYESDISMPGLRPPLSGWILKPATVLVWAILLMQITSSGIMYAKDFFNPFSESKAVADYLKQQGLANHFIMVSDPTIGPQISAYLQRPVFQTEAGIEGSFCHWELPFKISDVELANRIAAQLQQRDSIVVLLNRRIPFIDAGSLLINNKKCATVFPLQTFDRAFVRSEDYDVYLVTR